MDILSKAINKTREEGPLALLFDGSVFIYNKLRTYTYQVEDKLVSNYYSTVGKPDLKHQKELIHSLINEEQFILIILDACRYDYFNQEYKKYIKGDLDKVWSAGSRTPQWIPRTWTEYYDLTYISGAPYMSDLRSEDLHEPYTPSNHFKSIIPVWANNWDGKRFTTNPNSITKTAMSFMKRPEPTRLVIHYMQPHQPYIGTDSGDFRETPEIPVWDFNDTNLDREDIYTLNHPKTREMKRPDLPRYPVTKQLNDGELNIEQWRSAYRRNLQSILTEVSELIEYVDQDVEIVISSDHGEYLGEDSELLRRRLDGHPSRICPILREVPWFRVSDEEKRNKNIPDSIVDTVDYSEPNVSSVNIEERLADLGYLT